MGIENKKGIIFTTLAVLILSLFLTSLTFYSSVKEKKSIRDRVETMNHFIFSLEKDMERQIYISGYRAVLSIGSYITETGNFIDNAENSIKEAMINGTINNQSMGLMEGYKLSEWKSRVSDLSNRVNIYVDYSIINVSVHHEDPWNIILLMNINITFLDKGNISKWQKIDEIRTNINIEGFEDPLYLLNTNGLISNKIIKTPYSIFVNGADVSNLSIHANNSYYKTSTTGPSFLDRLEGKYTPNQFGIESLVNLNKLSAQGINTKDKSVIDYIYFSAINPAACNIAPSGLPEWFKIDLDHLLDYQVSCA